MGNSKLRDAANGLIEELIMATGLPDTPFTVVLSIEPLPVVSEHGDEGTSYALTRIVVNDQIWSADGV